MTFLTLKMRAGGQTESDDDPLGPARGLILGLELSCYMWGTLIYLLW